MEPLLAKLPSDSEVKNPATEWSDVAGMEELKLLIEEEIILPITHWETYQKYQVHPPNGILLYGPPGCGKTFIARRIADRIGRAFVEVTPSDIASIYVHGTQGRIRNMFDDAKKQAPAVIFFDEIDAMIPKRDSDVGHHYSSETNEFLTQLNECHKNKLLVIGATNRPERIDPAALRPGRMDRVVYVPPPDQVSREELFRLYLRDRPVATTLDYEKLADEAKGYSCADIENAVNHSARLAARGEELITMRHIFEALEKHQSTIRDADLKAFEKFRGVDAN
jgi:transitional endoplasmic reticulum ATPase